MELDAGLLEVHPTIAKIAAHVAALAAVAPAEAARQQPAVEAGDWEAMKAAKRRQWTVPARENASKPGCGLHFAKEGLLCDLRQLVAAGQWDADAVTDKHGLTALQWAAGGGHAETVAYLCDELGVSVDKANKEGRTPLMWAVRNGHLDVARGLVRRGADPRALTRKGVSCLHWATWGGSIGTLDWLLGLGLDLEAVSNAGCNSAVWVRPALSPPLACARAHAPAGRGVRPSGRVPAPARPWGRLSAAKPLGAWRGVQGIVARTH